MSKRKTGKTQKPSTTAARRPGPIWIFPAVIGFLTFAAFFPSLGNGFVWDDGPNLVENLHYRGLGWEQLRWMFSTFLIGHYQPLSWVTFGLDYIVWGINPFGYHLTNLLLHAANAILFYLLACRLLAIGLPSFATVDDATIRFAAAAASLIFAVHPLRVESVAWLTERRDVLSGLFVLCTLLFYLRAARADDDSSRRRQLCLAIVFFAMSLLSKASGITLPFVLLILDGYPLRRLGPGKWLGSEARRVLLEKVPFVALAIPFGIVALMAQHAAGALKPLEQYGIGARLAQAVYGIAFYLWKTAVPIGLSPLYELWRDFNPGNPHFLLSGSVVIVASAAFWMLRRRWPGCLASWACYILVLSPVLGVAQSGVQLVADRYTYLSCMGWAVLAGVVVACALKRQTGGDRPGRTASVMTKSLAAVVLLSLAVLTWRQSQIWHDSFSLWSYAVQVSPQSSMVHYNLGVALAKREDFEGAISHYRTALKYNPDYADVHYNLAEALTRRGEADEAIQHYRRSLDLKPKTADAHNNLAQILLERGELAEAVGHLRKAIEINPRYAQAYNNLGAALIRQGDLDGAVEQYKEGLRANPKNAVTYYNLGNLLAQRGRLEEAAEQLRAGLKVSPDDGGMHYSLGSLLLKQGLLDEAVPHLHETVRIDPSNIGARYHLAVALSGQGDLPAAAQGFSEILQLAPGLAAAHDGLARVLERQGKKDEALLHSTEAQRLSKSQGKTPIPP